MTKGFLFFFLCLFFLGSGKSLAHDSKQKESTVYTSAWYDQNPYQYIEEGRDGILRLTGLDPELTRAVISELHGEVIYQPLEWYEHKKRLIHGELDLASGVTKTQNLDSFVFYSVPYRFESTGLFIRKNKRVGSNVKNPGKLINAIQKNNFRLGVVKGFVQTDPMLNAFINDPKNRGRVFYARDNKENLRKLMNDEIDGFLADRLSGATLVWREGLVKQISEKPMGHAEPIHLALSKKTCTEQKAKKIDQALISLKKSGKLDGLFSKYVQPLILLQTLNSDWFFIIEILGTIAFAISGIILAYKDGASYFGTFVYALLPSAGGGVLRDLLLSRHEIAFVQSPIYILTVLGTTVVGILVLKIFFHRKRTLSQKTKTFFELTFFMSDSIGLASFCVLGVVVAMVMHATPLMIWGPFMAFLTGAGGGILRDLVRRTNKIQSLHGPVYPEVAVIWGLLFSSYLTIDAHKMNDEKIQLAMILTLVGVVLTRIFLRQLSFNNFFIAQAPCDVEGAQK